ncbi:MAG: hypothetical protein EP326_05525 [Deltaproteobacteria bacterium]|nr:MAG: hypothetical protein EP326_05525 [Deltaproteobacteria bacterium]TNF25723.1 MAG: hypothetical protein EP319_15580 [Deltaproteobacteria bacterium]
MKQVLLASILLIIGLFVGYFLPHNEKTEIEPKEDGIHLTNLEYEELKKSSDKAKELEKKVQSLSEINLEEYVSLKDQREKYLKADELFGKVMLLFLADLSLHMSDKVKDWASMSSEDRRDHFDQTFAAEVKTNPTPVSQTTYESNEFEVSSVADERQFQKEQILNAKQPFRGKLSFQDKLGRSMKTMMDSKVVRELWGKEIWDGPTQPIQLDQLRFYEVSRKGEFRRGTKTEAQVEFKLEINESKNSKKNFETRLKISIKNSKRFYFHFDDKMEAVHPVTHDKVGGAPCRGVILKGERGVLVYLSFLRDDSGKPDGKFIVGRLIDTRLKNPVLGNFLLEKSN